MSPEPLAAASAARRARWTGALALLLAAGALLLTGLGDQSLRGDEGAYAAIALDSELTGAGALQRVRDQVWVNKPPLLFWLQRGAMRCLGPTELAVRLPSAVAGILLVWLLYARARAERGPLEAALAAGLLLTAPGLLDGDVAHGLRSGPTDALLLLLLAAAIFAGRDALRRPGTGLARAAAWVALSSWVKGLNALLAPFVLALWSAARRPERRPGSSGVRGLLWLTAAALAAFLAWLALAALGGAPDPLQRLVGEDVIGRALAAPNPRHVRGAFYYVGRLVSDFGVFLLPAAWALVELARERGGDSSRSEADLARLAAVWALAPVVLLSLASAKLPWYIFPAYAGWALLCAVGTASLYRRARALGSAAGIALLVVLALAAALRIRAAASIALEQRAPNPLATLERVLDGLPGSGLLVAPSLRFGPDGIRGTNYFYFLRLRDRHGRRSSGEGCVALLADTPGGGPRGDGPLVRLHRIHRDDADLFVADACRGRVARALLELGVAEELVGSASGPGAELAPGASGRDAEARAAGPPAAPHLRREGAVG